MSYAITAAYIVAALLFIVGIRRMRNPETARIGNITSALGMLLAVVATLFTPGITNYLWIVVGIFAGSAVGYSSAERVAMTNMPQMVAAFNGVGGGAAALVALSEFHRVHDLTHAPQLFVFTSAVLFSVLVGGVSFAGSVVAFAKLQGIWPARLSSFPGQALANVLVFGGAVALGIIVFVGYAGTPAVAIVLSLAALLGILLVMPIGGADMPIVISLLNAFTGLAAAASGFALSNYVLIIAGSLVGASGTILTQLMSSSLGRSLPKILFGALAGGGKVAAQQGDGEEKPVHSASAEDVASILTADAESIIFVPGYGLAVAQAQKALSGLMEALESRGKEVRFAIHPVAGRMPGHMNVLMAEAEVPYDKLIDLEDINDDFADTDIVLVVGANDVVNPRAKEAGDTPISGMPVLDVGAARRVVFVKRSLAPGFAGIDNPLFYDEEKTMMLFADARAGLEEMLEAVKKS
ncbi:MAG TPA: NAD(P)(+) transhydrogenase (Re/Si-specific) subunit beta [Solirubrobacteraceae bacterium]|nr:NAD(P)(+) transhydrogenase (Re/Si-specific) subunit beta [Solirubrobacteraceae bacterium]